MLFSAVNPIIQPNLQSAHGIGITSENPKLNLPQQFSCRPSLARINYSEMLDDIYKFMPDIYTHSRKISTAGQMKPYPGSSVKWPWSKEGSQIKSEGKEQAFSTFITTISIKYFPFFMSFLPAFCCNAPAFIIQPSC